MNGMFGKVAVVSAALFAIGCGGGVDANPILLNMTGAEASSDVSDLAAVLTDAIDERGRLIPAGLERVRDRLDEQLRKMALAGPTATPDLYPTDASRWAYWYNARAAWSMKLADYARSRARLANYDISRALRDAETVDCRRAFPLDGREMSLEKIDSILLAEARRSGDFRLAACAPGAWVDYAPLPQKPFTEEDFTDGLDAALNRLVLDEQRFVVDVERRQVRIPPMLWDCRDMVVSWYRRRYGPCEVSLATALRAHLDGLAQRRLDNALGYAAVRQEARTELAVPGRKIFYPGSIGRVEP